MNIELSITIIIGAFLVFVLPMFFEERFNPKGIKGLKRVGAVCIICGAADLLLKALI